ncbi:MAG: ABC transporter substrate-binding protein [Coriobacteriales bacterium]|nr:ABC transporter substrate-binding protein [Coriobacteriales bacterium]
MKNSRRKPLVRELQKLMLLCLSLLLAASMVLFSGCQDKSAGTETTDEPSQTATETEVDPMADRTIVDAAGRELTIPGVGALERVYFTGATGEIYTFTLAPELAVGTTMEYTPEELKYLPAEMADLPVMASLNGGAQLNPEEIVAQDVQIVLSVCTAAPTEADISQADELQLQIGGVPVVVLDGSFDKVAETYRLLGEIFGKEEAAEELATYCETAYANVTAAVAQVPESERVSLYYAEGPEGLQTEPETSTHAYIFQVAGAKNVAEVEAKGGKGMSDVSLEQVIAWNPDVIIAWDEMVRGGADQLIRTDSDWASIKAVQDGRVYTMCNTPFSWCDRPPSVNRFLGMQWVANILYPQYYDVDMVEVTKEFYSKFYHVELTDDQAKELLGNSYPPVQ